MNSFPLTFVVAANDRSILNQNLLASPCLKESAHQIVIQEGYCSAASAYNDALTHSKNEIIAFVHQDVYLPENWTAELTSALNQLECSDPNWGVVGCWGITHDGGKIGHLYTPGDMVMGQPFNVPGRVRVLDEVVLVIRKSSGLQFSEDIPGFHFYGADVCLTAERKAMSCYAISAFCVHNSRQYFEYPDDFYASYKRMKFKWRRELPIQTSCIQISRLDRDLWKRRVKKVLAKVTGRSLERGPRANDPSLVLNQIRAKSEF